MSTAYDRPYRPPHQSHGERSPTSSYRGRGQTSPWRPSQNSPRRGSYRGGRGRGSNSGSYPKGKGILYHNQLREDKIPTWVYKRGDPMRSLSLDEMKFPEAGKMEKLGIEDVELLGSYNWIGGIGGEEAKIMVPGRPPIWRPTLNDKKLPEDDGDFYRDINAAHYPPFPSEPAIRALLHLKPSFDISDFDLFACGSTLGNLLRFALEIPRSFRFDVDVVGNTVFFVRKENSARELIKGVKGYGHSFAERNTDWEADVGGSESHQRIVRYKFGGMNMAVRFESDGYLPKSTPKEAEKNTVRTKEEFLEMLDNTTFDEEELRELSYMFSKKGTQRQRTHEHWKKVDEQAAALKSSRPPPAAALPEPKSLTIIPGGTLIPQSYVFDLKTRSSRSMGGNGIDMEEVYRRLWVNQTPNFILAYHLNGSGVFTKDNVTVSEISAEVKEWEERNRTVLWKFKWIVERILELVRESKMRRFEVSRVGSGPVEIRRMVKEEKGKRCLPKDLLEKWDKKDGKDSIPDSDARLNGDKDGPLREVPAKDYISAWKQSAPGPCWEDDLLQLSATTSEAGSDHSESDEETLDYTHCKKACEYCGKCKPFGTKN